MSIARDSQARWGSSSEAGGSPYAELEGWASIAEHVMAEAAVRVVAEVLEPTGRAALLTEAAQELAALVAAAAADALRAGRATLVREGREAAEERAAQAAAEAEETQGRLDGLRGDCAALQSALGDAAACLDAVEENDGGLSLPELAARVCGRLLESEERAGLLRGRLAQLEGSPVTGAVTEGGSPQPAYERLLPAMAVSAVSATLLRVRAQVRELREPSQGPSPGRAAYFPPHLSGVTPPRRPPGGYDDDAGPRWTWASSDGAGGSPSPAPAPTAWRDRMSELQSELRGLRRELGAPE